MNPDEVLDFLKSRRSIRKFKKNAVPDKDIHRAIEAASYAPSNGNYQPWKFLYIQNEDSRKGLEKIVIDKIEVISKGIEREEWRDEFQHYSRYFTFFINAPALIVALYKRAPSTLRKILKNNEINQTRSELASISAAIQNMLLMLHAMGYGACWMTGPLLVAKEEMEEFLDIRRPFEIASLIPFGIPEKRPDPPRRKELRKVLAKI
ncbi:MAG: nitroreductase family protein [bacterium]